ncbi:hypothetical protein VM98_18580 [Streptomyces rubellomurinus subsp. indigoferus]|nr:hypothetical protein VM98_18580 [Streptomyces rubellomurinus subsp. indigoferus]
MADDTHPAPGPPEGPPPSPARHRRALPWLAGALALAVLGGGALWLWKPWQSQELPQSACWSALSRDDLKPLAGKSGRTTQQGAARLQTPTGPQDPANRGTTCVLDWFPDGGDGSRALLSVQVGPALHGIEADRTAESAQGRPVAILDVGGGAAALATTEPSRRVQFYVRCDVHVPPAGPNAQYIRIDVGGSTIDGASPAKARQAYADIALKVARVAAEEYECGDKAQLPATAPAVPDLATH